MAIKHQDIKNLVMQELLNESINNEGVIDWFRAQSSKATSGVGKALSGAGKTLSGAGEKLKPGDPQIAKKLEKVGDFLQMAQRDKDITQLIMQTDLGKKVFSSQEKSLEEALGQDFVKMMKDKKVTPQEVEAFVAAMNKNKKAKQMLDGLGLDIQVSDQDIEAGKQQGAPADATAQTQAQPSQPQPDQQVKPGEAQPQTKQDTSTTDIQQQTKRDLKPTQKGTKDAIGTAEYKKSLEGLSSVISNTLNIPTANAQKIIDDIWSQLGGKNGKFTKLTLLEQEFQLNLTKILQNNGIVGLKASNLINKIKEWTKQNSNFVTDKIGQQPPQTPVPASTPADATAQTQAQPVAGQQQAGADNVIAVFKGKSAGPNGAIDSLQTQLIRQFGSKIPAGDKLITAITKDLMNQLKANGLKVQESVEQVEQFLLKELIDNKLEHQSLSYLLKENNSLDYRLTSQILESLQEGREREKKRKEEHVRQLGFVFDNGEVNWKAFTAAVKDAKQKGEAKDDDEFIINGLRKRKGEGEKDLGGAAAVQNTKDAEQNNIAAAGQLAADTKPNPSQNVQRTQDSVIPQPAPVEPSPAKAMGPVRANTSAALRKAADAAFKQITPTRPGIVNVGEVVGRKLKAIAQLNAKAGLALVPMVPKILQAIEKFIADALAKSGKKDSVKIVGGSKNAVALQKTLTNIKSKGIMSGPPEQQAKPTIQKESLKRILMEEIFNAIVGKNK